MVLPTARKPDGGFQFISVSHLCAVWSAYDNRQIRLCDVRLWCATQEMVARRCQLPAGQQPMYRHNELRSLSGGKGGITLALARLQTACLLTWDTTALTFSPPAIVAHTPLATMLAQIPNHHRRIPVPRRLLRFLAKGGSRVLLATILGHLFRCLYYRQGRCHADGFCKASWIAEVFGVSERAVKTARQRLEALGFLHRTDTPQWVRNRYGQKMTINLQWEGTAPAVNEPDEPASKAAPPPEQKPAAIAPPDSDRKLLTEHKYQKPAGGGPTGILSTLFVQARACLRTGAAQPEEPLLPAHIPPVIPFSHRQTSPIPLRLPSLPPPCLQRVLVHDLQDMGRLLTLYTQAVQTQMLSAAEVDRLNFVALAQHVLHFQPKNPGGLFVQLLKHRLFAVITQTEEDQARYRLNTYLYARSEGKILLNAA